MGIWQLPESGLRVLGDVAGRDVLELGCGGARWSVALARAGARVIGLDLSERQLAHARLLMDETGVRLPLVLASAEAVPLADASMDIVFCDYGAMTFADPYRTVPAVARVLRPGGLFAFSTSSPLLDLCWPDAAERAGDRLVRDYFGIHRLADDDGKVSFQLPYGESHDRAGRGRPSVTSVRCNGVTMPITRTAHRGWPMDREGWRPFLKRWSEEWISAQEPGRDGPLDEAVVRDVWLGFAPASAAGIAAAEARLGRRLPPSLREFLLVTDGWRDAGDFIYRLAGAEELAWLRDTDDARLTGAWLDGYTSYGDPASGLGVAEGEIFRRALRVSLAGDAAMLLLDPGDVDERGEWAGYWHASWDGVGLVRHASFADLMWHLYVGFHALRKPAGGTRDHWDAEVERARLAALAGGIEEPLAVLEQAQAFGRDRARVLRFQLLAMLGDWYTVPLSHVVLVDDRAGLLRSPLFSAELLPLLLVEGERTHRGRNVTLEHLTKTSPELIQPLVDDDRRRRRHPRFGFGNPAFDAAVHRIVDRLTADPAYQFDAAWPDLRDAMRLWRPSSGDHVAPVVLFAHPLLAELLTRERGREILSMPRGDRK